MRVDESWLDITGQMSKNSHQNLNQLKIDERVRERVPRGLGAVYMVYNFKYCLNEIRNGLARSYV
jgi:hypothetical protein